MRILVTGGAGFIGSNLADAFVARGDDVLVIDDLSTGREVNVPREARLERSDIRSPGACRALEGFRPGVLCHLAAQLDVRTSVVDPAHDADVNILGSLRLFEACRTVGTRRVLFASTGGAIYGEQDVYPCDETHPTRPISPYGVAKLSVEHYLHYYATIYGVRTTCLRFANVYGPRQSAHGEAGVVAIFAHKLLAGEIPVINGAGDQTRDFVFVNDVVRANLVALEKDLTGAYNVGTGVETSVLELYASLQKATGVKDPAKHAPAKLGEQMRSCLDARRLERDSGFRPRTSLDDGIRATVAYFRSQRR